MQSVKCFLAVSIFLALGLVTQSTLITRAQTPDSKPKPTASISGRVTIGDKPAPGVTVVANLLSSPQTLVAQATSDAHAGQREPKPQPPPPSASVPAVTGTGPTPAISQVSPATG